MGLVDGQIRLFEYEQAELGAYDTERLKLKTTGATRTGCYACGFGCVAESRHSKETSRFIRLKEDHPNIYKALFSGGRYEYQIKDRKGEDIKIKRIPYEMVERWCEANKDNPRFLIRKTWKPHKGFGYKHIIDWINEHGNFNIRY